MHPVSTGLLAVADGLSRARTVAEIAEVVLAPGVEVVGGAAGVLLRVDGDSLALVAHRGYPDGTVRGFERIALDQPLPITRAVTTATPVYLAGDELAAYPVIQASRARSGTQALCAIPLIVDRRTLGVMGVSFTRAPAFDGPERAFLEAIAQLAAQAFERVDLFEAEHAARTRVRELYELASLLAGALTVEQVVEIVLGGGLRAMRASAGAIFLASEARDALTLFRATGYPDDVVAGFAHVPIDRAMPISDAFRTGELRAYPDAASFARAYPDLPPPSTSAARVAAPLIAGEQPFGALAFSAPGRAGFDEAELRHAAAVAHLCAQALDRAFSFERERAARALAEQATRLREDLVAVVSHDLRNPLASLTTAVELLTRSLPPDVRERADRFVMTIARAGERMTRLLDDLLDVAAIEAGRLTLTREPEDLGAIVREAVELHLPMAAARSIALTHQVEELPAIACDRHRILQILANLIGNALKFTPSGGRVRVGAAPDGAGAVVWVEDDGPGIAPEQLPYLFDRYFQGRPRVRGGVGLGLSIARGLVAAHGGEITVESRPGEGARFRFSLPGE